MEARLDLARILGRFPDVCRAKYGRTFNLHKLEKKLERVHSGERWLVAKDVGDMFDAAASPFGLYWRQTDLKELDARLKGQRLYLAPVEGSGQNLVNRLLAVFHNIGVASIVLRFVHPDRFGVFSTPVINLLQVHRPHTVDLYIAYCEELRDWEAHFRLAGVAETETALWTFQSLASVNEKEYAVAQRDFDADLWIQRRRAAQVLRPFLKRYGPLELARIIIYEDPKLAGKIAAEEYERLLREASLRFLGCRLAGTRGAAEALIDQLAQKGIIAPGDQFELKRVWMTRNKAVHPGPPPAPEEIEVMIDRIQQLCAGWEGKKIHHG